jgi:hypothetical protein
MDECPRHFAHVLHRQPVVLQQPAPARSPQIVPAKRLDVGGQLRDELAKRLVEVLAWSWVMRVEACAAIWRAFSSVLPFSR